MKKQGNEKKLKKHISKINNIVYQGMEIEQNYNTSSQTEKRKHDFIDKNNKHLIDYLHTEYKYFKLFLQAVHKNAQKVDTNSGRSICVYT